MSATLRTFCIAVIGWILIALLLVGLGAGLDRINPDARWTLIDVNDNRRSGDAQVLQLGDRVWMIDAGFKDLYRRSVKPWFEAEGITAIDGFVLTHAHRNHFEGLLEMIADGINIGEIIYTPPPERICKTEDWPGGCRMEHQARLIAQIEQAGIPVREPVTGDVLYDDDGVRLEILYQPEAMPAVEAGFLVNDFNTVLRLSVGNQRALLTGDAGVRSGQAMMRTVEDLKADILLVPHHGLMRTVEDAFFDRVSPKIAVVSGPGFLYARERGWQVRNWAARNDVDVYVTGRDGNIDIVFEGDRWEISTAQD